MMNFIKRFSFKQKAVLLLLIMSFSAASYFIYDKYFASKMVIASIEPYNFTDVDIVDLFVNDVWGGNSHAHSGAGGGICCVLIPDKWRPGLVANIKWQKTEDPTWYTAVVDIPEYSKPADLQILFLEKNNVKIYINYYWPCTPMHPMPKKDLCEAKEKP